MMTDTTRYSHLAWCKSQARAHVDAGRLVEAIGSMVADLQKHDGTRMDPVLLGHLAREAMKDLSPASVRKWIKGFG